MTIDYDTVIVCIFSDGPDRDTDGRTNVKPVARIPDEKFKIGLLLFYE